MTGEDSTKKNKEKSEDKSKLSIIILAAGKGTRMKSPLPKVLHPVAGIPMIHNSIQAAFSAGAGEIRIVVGYQGNMVKQVVDPLGAICFFQNEQLGTAHAVRSAQVDTLEGTVVIMNGDHPLIEGTDILAFVKEFNECKADLALVTCDLPNPGQMGRIVRQHGEIKAIVEAKDASVETLKIKEINTGIYIAKAETLQEYLPKIKNFNVQKEYYLTDIVSLCLEDQCKVIAIKANKKVAVGVNSQEELARATKLVFQRKAKRLMEEGVIFLNPKTTYVEETVEIGMGSVIYPNVFLRGKTKLGSFTVVEPNCFISDSEIANSVQVKAGSYIEKSKIADNCSVGPYARLRPETELEAEAHIGNFVELKKVKFGKKSKAGHLTYLGDAEIGEDVNIGCGTITCNYAVDRKKYKTKIGSGVFVGSDTQFVAPIEIGDNAVIGSGSTITKDVPAQALAVARGKQFIKENYVPLKKSENEGKE